MAGEGAGGLGDEEVCLVVTGHGWRTLVCICGVSGPCRKKSRRCERGAWWSQRRVLEGL